MWVITGSGQVSIRLGPGSHWGGGGGGGRQVNVRLGPGPTGGGVCLGGGSFTGSV